MAIRQQYLSGAVPAYGWSNEISKKVAIDFKLGYRAQLTSIDYVLGVIRDGSELVRFDNKRGWKYTR